MLLQNHRTLLLKGPKPALDSRALSKPEYFLIHCDEFCHLRWRARLTWLLEGTVPPQSQRQLRTVLRDQTIEAYSLFLLATTQKFSNSSPASLNFTEHQGPVLQTTPNRTQFPDLWSHYFHTPALETFRIGSIKCSVQSPYKNFPRTPWPGGSVG